jgi:hypothetical protein
MFVLLISVQVISAETISLQEFTARLSQTASLLREAVNNLQNRDSKVTQAAALWRNVDHVRLDDGSTITVDLSWLTTPLKQYHNSDGTDPLTKLVIKIDAIIGECGSSGCTVDQRQDAKAALAKILQDPRFNYPPVAPDADPIKPPDFQWLIDLFQIAIVITVIVALSALVFFAVRSLINQRRVKPTEQIDSDDPTTSAEAINRATGSENEGDYRAAIRYLYLSSLLLLDERNVMKYEPTLTNREHLQRIANRPHLSEALRPVVNTFDRVWYGFAPVDEPAYAEFRRNVQQLREVTPNE